MANPSDVLGDTWRIPAYQLQDLRDVARGLEESNAGVCTRYLLDELERSGPPGADDVSMFDAERFVARYSDLQMQREFDNVIKPWRARVIRCRRALAALAKRGDHHSVGVLHVTYGYPDPIVRSWPQKSVEVLGELAPLVRYTDATERVRAQLVKDGVAGEVARRRWVGCEPKEAPPEGVVDIFDRYWAEKHLDAVTSSGDALRSIFDPFEEPTPKKGDAAEEEHKARREAWEARRDAHVARRSSFILEARVEADQMLTGASRAYWDEWQKAK